MSRLHRLQLIYGVMMLLLAVLVSLNMMGNVALASNSSSVQGSQGVEAPSAKVGGTTGSAIRQSPLCDPNWVTVPDPPLSGLNGLRGVAVVSANDVWAVGYGSSTTAQLTLIEHWDGASWSVVPSPNLDPEGNYLWGVAVVSANDVWAVGYHGGCFACQNSAQTLILHWDGSSWTVVPSPVARHGILHSVAVVSANDVWAVGQYNPGAGGIAPLIEHWDGSSWSIVAGPSVPSNSNLWEVAVVSANDVWAVGASGANGDTLILRWNGSTWRVWSSPSPGTWFNKLESVAVVSANDVWAVGYYIVYPNLQQLTLIMHWDGGRWSVVPSPNLGTGDNILMGVAAVSANDVWAVGNVITHWDGSSWSVPSTADNGLNSVAVVSANDVWAVGESSFDTVIMRYNPCPPTPTPTPTPCAPGSFSDMPPDNPFYPYVTCLVNRGIISGYADCTFRPNNQVTRSQLAKIVSNAANFTESPDPQIFEDVSPTNTFYQWINRLSRRGFMGGYTCGGPGEPCVNGDRPYFRPVANATRGQTSKIVANTAGYNEEPSGQTFEDVSPTHTFYREIQRLAVRNIMGGYPCGGNGEPCLSGKPYFRPQNNVTRGQSAKIVANTFYPNCQTP